MSAATSCERCHRVFKTKGGSTAPPCPHCGFSPPQALPKSRLLALRSDIVMEPVEEEGTLYYVIKDPRANRFFRIKPLEHYLVSQFDGTTPLEEIRKRASEEKKVLISQEVLARFAAKFCEIGLLVSNEGEIPTSPSVRSGSAASILTWKFPLANPERLVGWLYPKLKWCFTPLFVSFAGVVILIASVVLIANRTDLVFGLVNVVSLEGLGFVMATIAAVTVLHELAHALTCRHFGGRVTDMGFLVLYLVPCFYCNVSNTYLMREKRQRLWVLFAGGFFELFIWAGSVLAWHVVAPETFVSRALFVIVAVCGIRSLFNFNPLIKMDGYFLLSDYLAIANLRKEALVGLSNLLRRGAALETRPRAAELKARRILSMRGDRFMTLFSGAALLYTVALIGYLVFHSGGWVFDQFGANALALFFTGARGPSAQTGADRRFRREGCEQKEMEESRREEATAALRLHLGRSVSRDRGLPLAAAGAVRAYRASDEQADRAGPRGWAHRDNPYS